MQVCKWACRLISDESLAVLVTRATLIDDRPATLTCILEQAQGSLGPKSADPHVERAKAAFSKQAGLHLPIASLRSLVQHALSDSDMGSDNRVVRVLDAGRYHGRCSPGFCFAEP